MIVLDVVTEEARRPGHEIVALAVDHDAASTAETDLELDLVAVRVLANPAARRDRLKAHREAVEPGVLGVSFGSA
jgi:hypothetical protein